MTIVYYYFNIIQFETKEGPRQTEQDESVRLNISLSSRALWSVLWFPVVACFTQLQQNLSVTAEIQYIKRDTFEIFTPNNKNHCENAFEGGSSRWNGDRRQRVEGGGTKHPGWNEKKRFWFKHTLQSFFTQHMLSCSPIFKSSQQKTGS